MSITGKRNNSGKGFTLLELVLVVTLIGLLCSVAFPRLSHSVRSTGLRESAGVLAEMIRFARVEAMHRGVRTCFKLNESGAFYWFEVQDCEAGNQEAFKRFERGVLDEAHVLPTGVRIQRLEEGEQSMAAKVIVFTPDGISRPYRVLLRADNDQQMAVEIGAWCDQVDARVLNSGNRGLLE